VATCDDLWRPVATWPWQSLATDYGTRQQLAESPLQNTAKSQSTCLNEYNNSIHGYCQAFCRYIDMET